MEEETKVGIEIGMKISCENHVTIDQGMTVLQYLTLYDPVDVNNCCSINLKVLYMHPSGLASFINLLGLQWM